MRPWPTYRRPGLATLSGLWQQSLIVGFRVNCPERPETVQENIREIAPHFLVAPPRIWENLVSLVQVKMEDASFVKRRLYQSVHAIWV